MKNSVPNWAEKRKNGLVSFLFFDGILKMGAPFAVVMQIIGYFVLRDAAQTTAEYFGSSTTWLTFFLHATVFGLLMGIVTWFRNEKAYKNVDDISSMPDEETKDI